MLSTHGGIRAADGTPIALGYHTGHWEVGLLLEAAAGVFKTAGAIPFAAACTDPCDGRSQGTTAMFDSLPFRNDAATIFRRLIRSLPTRRGVLGVATCDKGLPAMMMALAASHDLPAVLVPGGVTLMPEQGEDAGKVQTLGVRFVHGSITLEEAADLGCRACGSPGGGCQFLGTAATSQVVGEALGMSLGHSALAPSGHPIWIDMARRSATALMALESQHTHDARHRDRRRYPERDGRVCRVRRIDESHPACARDRACGRAAPAVAAEWAEVNRLVPRLVDALPNGPRNHPTVQVFMAGGVPEVMLHLRRLELLDTSVKTVSGGSLDAQLDAWESSDRRTRLRAQLQKEGVNPDDVIVAPEHARGPRADVDGLFSSGQPRAGRIGDQEHGDRSVSGRRRRRISADRPREGVSVRARRDGGHQGESDFGGRCARADRPRADGRRHGGDLSDYERADGICRSASTSRSSPTPVSAASRPARASATSRRRRSPAGRSASCATAT